MVTLQSADGKNIAGINDWFSFAPPAKGAIQWKDGRSANKAKQNEQDLAAFMEVLSDGRQRFATGEAERGRTALWKQRSVR